MANKIFYVDPKNGSNSNDGSSPSKAWADITMALSTDNSTSDAPALIYVRRSGDQTLSNAIDWTKNPNRIIIGWPNEGEPYYNERPKDGQDAGWDEKVVNPPKIIINKNINAQTTSSNILGFYNMEIETSADNTSLAIQYSIGDISLVNCIINHQRTNNGYSLIEFKRIDGTKGKTSLTISDSNISYYGMLFGCNDNVNWPEVEFTFTSSDNTYEANHDGNGIWYWEPSQTTQNISSTNDGINSTNKDNRFVNINGQNDNYAPVSINIDNMKFNGKYFIYGKQRYKLTLNVENSNISASEGAGIIRWQHRYSTGIDYKTDTVFKNCVLNGERVLYLDNSYDNGYNVAIGDIEFIDCEVQLTNELINFISGVNIYSKKLIIDNCKVNATSLITSSRSGNFSIPNTYINIHDSNISSNVCNRIKNYVLSARDSSFNQLSASDYPDGNNQIHLINSKVTGGSFQNDLIFSNASELSGVFKYAKIEAFDSKVTLDSSMDIVLKNCNTSSAPSQINKQMEFFSCVVNDNPVPYAKLTNSYSIHPSNVVRVNGNNGSLKLQNPNGLYFFNINKLKFIKPANKTKIILFLAAQTDIGDLFNYGLVLNYEIDNKANAYLSPIISIAPSTEEWSGLYNGYKSYQLEFDVPKHSQDVEIITTLTATNNSGTAPTSSIYFDLKPAWD